MEAFGHPGLPPVWATARKVGVGTALSSNSKVWFTLARGIVTEVYYPRVDMPNLRDLQFLISDGQTFVHEEQFDTEHIVEYLDPRAPAYRLINTDREGRYRLVKRVITDPDSDALVMHMAFEALRGQPSDYTLYVLVAPQVKNRGYGNFARVVEYRHGPALLAWREDIHLALVASTPFSRASVGFVGFSDGWQDLRNFRMDWTFDAASDGHVALTGQIALGESSQLTLALGFGPDSDEALFTAIAAVEKDFDALLARYLTDWRNWFAGLHDLSTTAHDGGRLFRTSAIALKSHEDKTYPGAFVASLSVPWGETQGDANTGGYHLVWPRDLVHIATSLLAIGDQATAAHTLKYLAQTQRPDGSWPQNMWLDGTPYWNGLQLDEVALPILLAWHLARCHALDFDPYPNLVRRAALFIARHGPVTPQERWEENGGYSPATLAAEITALVCAGEFARAAGETSLADYLLSVADYWATKVEDWTFTHCGELLPGYPEYYERIASLTPENLDQAGTECRVFLPLRNLPPHIAQHSQCCIVDAGFLELVRHGVRAPNDPHISKSLAMIDSLLEVDTLSGPAWHRYNHDGYGEKADGAPYDGTGVGRAWPLLTGERGHYELAAGHNPVPLVAALEGFANEGGFLPEQVWDAPDIPERNLLLGRGTESATPLAWAHAEYVKLLRSLADGQVFDCLEPVYQRYVRQGVRSSLVICKFNHKVRAIRSEQRLRLEVYAPAELHWSADEWATVHREPMVEIAPGVRAREFPSGLFSSGRALRFTYYWPQVRRWEGRDFVINVV